MWGASICGDKLPPVLLGTRNCAHRERAILFSGGDDDHLAEWVRLTDVDERLRYLIERERAVDVDVNVASDATLGDRLELLAFPAEEVALVPSSQRGRPRGAR